ncbi:Heavy metal-associated domain containing protein [Parasponia andersonii]|uniref:Heavy metal-associated domain containing protein n=1 Tax=Parasponia andersonii TaxID=3476 RepID=A0A2P5AXW2_PARAD|nr:Heavy metal-associated domain containing protein [Parasponia andersonii]
MGYSWHKKARANSLVSNTTIELIVQMDCAGCESKIKKALLNLKGVDDVDVDMNMQKVTVMGWADQEKILKTVRRTGKRADMWPYTQETQHNITVQQYYHQHNHSNDHDHSTIGTTAFYDSVFPIIPSNYFQNGHDFGYYYNQQPPFSTLVDDKATSMFSDENPHACSIM